MRPIICDICGKTISKNNLNGDFINIDVYGTYNGVHSWKEGCDMCTKCYEHIRSTVHNIAMQTQERK